MSAFRLLRSFKRLPAIGLGLVLAGCVSVDMEPLETAGQALDESWTDERIRAAASDAPPVFVPEERLSRRVRYEMDASAGEVIAIGARSRAGLARFVLDPLDDPAAFAAEARARAVPPPPPGDED